MDFLSRLIAGSAATAPIKQSLNTPVERLTACKRLCTSLQSIWRNGARHSSNNNPSGQIAKHIDRLNTILHDESRTSAPHSCLQHVVSVQIYVMVTKLALSSDDRDVTSAARQFFHLLINGEAEAVLDSKVFARSLVDLVRDTAEPSRDRVDEKGRADFIELLFEIATKIRLDSDILSAWFYPERDQVDHRAQATDTRRSQFPLFYVLIQYVHHDAPVGDFARTGLLYLADTSSKSKTLERWMIESDLAQQMASGLVALYSCLSRDSHITLQTEKALPVVVLSDHKPSDNLPNGVFEQSCKDIKAFLSYLVFWQDMMDHCKSEEVKDTLADHFQVLFVQQVLYPSLLESSDVVGGSTPAVMFHLCHMLEAFEHPRLVRRMLRYLFTVTEQSQAELSVDRSSRRMSVSRRKSMEKLATQADLMNSPSPGLFNLLDLLVMGLHSRQSPTIDASLKIITTVLQRHHPHVLSRVFRLHVLAGAEAKQDIAGLNMILCRLFDLSGNIARLDTMDDSYQAALVDGQILLQMHSCMSSDCRRTSTDVEHSVHLYAIASDCRLLEAMLDVMASFLINDTVTNIILTETLMALASCEHVSLRHWLYIEPDTTVDSREVTLVTIFESLAGQLKILKETVTEWDMLLLHQKTKLATETSMQRSTEESISHMPGQSSPRKANSPQPKQRPATPTRLSSTGSKKGASPGFRGIDSTLARSPNLTPTSPSVKILAGSPLYQTSFPGEETLSPASMTTVSEAPSDTALSQLNQTINLSIESSNTVVGTGMPQLIEAMKINETRSSSILYPWTEMESGTATPNEDIAQRSPTLQHVMTNVIILQEFILEMAAMLQIRATLFDEVDNLS